MVDTNNDTLSSSKLIGKLVIIQFWASWCTPCIEELPTLKTIYEKYGKEKLEIISISIDEDSLKFQNAVKKYEMNWHQVYGDKKLFNELGITTIPELYMINKNGITIYNREASKDYSLLLLTKLVEENIK